MCSGPSGTKFSQGVGCRYAAAPANRRGRARPPPLASRPCRLQRSRPRGRKPRDTLAPSSLGDHDDRTLSHPRQCPCIAQGRNEVVQRPIGRSSGRVAWPLKVGPLLVHCWSRPPLAHTFKSVLGACHRNFHVIPGLSRRLRSRFERRPRIGRRRHRARAVSMTSHRIGAEGSIDPEKLY
jgi:hypothetical protein